MGKPEPAIELPLWYIAMVEAEAESRARWEKESRAIDDMLEVVEDGGD